MFAVCNRCRKETREIIRSLMNEDKICTTCLEDELRHPRFNEAKKKKIQEALKGNYNYPGLFSGQKYPFTKKTAAPGFFVSENKKLSAMNSPCSYR